MNVWKASSPWVTAAVAAGITAAGIIVSAAPTADAAPQVVFSSQGGQILGTAKYMRTMAKSCLLSREMKADVDGPLSTFSSDSRLTNGAEATTKASQITLRTRKLPPGWYEVAMSCAYPDHGFNRPEVSRTGRVLNR